MFPPSPSAPSAPGPQLLHTSPDGDIARPTGAAPAREAMSLPEGFSSCATREIPKFGEELADENLGKKRKNNRKII